MEYTNLDDYSMSCMSLVKAGYGSLKEIQELDTKEFLDCIEYENINNTVQNFIYEDARN